MFIFGFSQAETALTQSTSDGSNLLWRIQTWIEGSYVQTLSSPLCPLCKAHGGCREPLPTPEGCCSRRQGLNRTRDLYISLLESYLFLLPSTRTCARDWLAWAANPIRTLGLQLCSFNIPQTGSHDCHLQLDTLVFTDGELLNFSGQ